MCASNPYLLPDTRSNSSLSWLLRDVVLHTGRLLHALLWAHSKASVLLIWKNMRAGKPSRADWFTMFIKRKNIRAGKPSRADWFAIFIERKNIRAGKPSWADWFTMFHSKSQIDLRTVGRWVWIPFMICLGWWAGTTGPPRTPTSQGCEHLCGMSCFELQYTKKSHIILKNKQFL